jgi:predicted MFS family arabinose efflux permease
MGYALIAPFLPLEFNDKGISAGAQGAIFAIYAVGVVVWSLIVVNINVISRK